MPSIDPSIVQHEIKTYEKSKLIRQKLWPVNHRKRETIKAEVEKLLKVGFIYPIPLMDWVSNPAPIDKKQGTIRISIRLEDQHKTTFICPWGTFAYIKMPFCLKNARATFQWAMSYTFHDIKHIIESYLDNLAARSRNRIDHPSQVRLVFERCRFYKIRLNHNKCILAVTSG
eukprot:PITA_34425